MLLLQNQIISLYSLKYVVFNEDKESIRFFYNTYTEDIVIKPNRLVNEFRGKKNNRPSFRECTFPKKSVYLKSVRTLLGRRDLIIY